LLVDVLEQKITISYLHMLLKLGCALLGSVQHTAQFQMVLKITEYSFTF